MDIINIGLAPNDGTGDTLRDGFIKTNANFAQLNGLVFMGDAEPTDTPTGTGNRYWNAVVPGTYTNFGNVVVNSGSIAVISYIGSGFTISQTALNLTGYTQKSEIVDNLSSTASNVPLSAAQGKVLNDKFSDYTLTEKSVKIEVGKNLFNYLDVIVGLINITTGVIDTSQINWRISNYIEVPPSTQISISSIYRITQYDINRVFISGTETNPQAQKTFTTSATTAFIRINDYYSAIPTTQVEIGATSSTYEAYKISEISKLNKNESVSFYNKYISGIQTKLNTIPTEQLYFERGKNLLNPDTLIYGSLNQLTGVLSPSAGTWKYSDYIEVSGNQTISIKYVYRIAEYNVDKVFITGQQNDSQGQKTFTTNINTSYIVIYGYQTTFSGNQVEIGASTTTVVPYTSNLTVNKTISNKQVTFEPLDLGLKWKNKTMLCLGDSVTEANYYQTTVKSILGLTTLTTKAKGGLGIVQIMDGNGSDYIGLTASDLTGVNIITFFGGLNDRGSLVGNITDVYPTQDTIMGRYRYVINKLYTLAGIAGNKTIRVVFIAPHKVGKYGYIDADGGQEYPTGSGQTLETIVNKLKELCGFYGIPVIDLYHNSGINNFTWDVLTSNTGGSSGPYPANLDNVHPNVAGYLQIGRYIGHFINNL